MIRMSKMADYGIIMMVAMARSPMGSMLSARDLAQRTHIPLPTVGKILKALCRGGLLASYRGPRGGYTLTRTPEQISVIDILELLDGPMGLTDCTMTPSPGGCELEATCPVRGHWSLINTRVTHALRNLTLREMASPLAHLQRESQKTILPIVEQ